MPKIVRSGGLNLTDEVVKIHDLGPRRPQKSAAKRPRAEIDAETGDTLAMGDEQEGEQGELEEDFAAEDFGGGASVSASSGGSSAAIKNEIIQSAMSEAGRILEDAIKKAEEAKNEHLAQVQAEADEMRRAAMEEGRRDGCTQAIQEVQQAADSLENAIASFEGERAGFEAEYEDQLKWLAIEIASKVLAKKVGGNDAEMLEMVQKAVQSVKSEPWIRIEVSQEMVGLIDRLTAAYDAYENIEVSPIPADAGTVHIETPSGVVDASLRTQLENLRDYFAQAAG